MNKKLNKFRFTKSKDEALSKRLKTDIHFKIEVENKLVDFIDLLGYDLRSTPIYAHIDHSTFEGISWKEAPLFLRNKSLYNHTLKRYEQQKVSFCVESNILKHSFPLELKNKIKYKNKQFYGSDVEDEVLHNMHFLADNMCGCYFKKSSNILPIDIDTHKGQGSLYSYQIMKEFISFMKSEPIYMEVSHEGGYHLFFKLDKEYTYYEKKLLVKEYIDKTKNEIETPQKMRCPNSLPYTPVDSEFEVFSYLDAIDRAVSLYNKNPEVSLFPESIQSEELELKHQEILKPKPVRIENAIYQRKNKSDVKLLTVDEFISSTDLEISTSNRIKPMYKIICAGKFNGWSIDEICSVIYALDNKSMPSKDLSHWSYDTLYKEVEATHASCKTYAYEFSSGKPDKFISNIEHIPDHILSLIDEPFIKTLIRQVHKKSSNYKVTKKNINKFSIVFKEMVGSIFYYTHNNRITKNNHSQKYLIGAQFSESYAQALSEFYSFENINTWGIVNSILKHSSYFKQYKHNSRGWKFDPQNPELNFCRQFDIFSNKDHVLFNDKSKVSFLIFNSIKEFILIHSVKHKVMNYLNYVEVILYNEVFSLVNSVSLRMKDKFSIDVDVGLCYG